MIKVVASGAAGKMGMAVCRAVIEDDNLELVGAVDKVNAGEDINGSNIKIDDSLERVMDETHADVLVDFTIADSVIENAEIAIKRGAHIVIGTTGLAADKLDALKVISESSQKNILYAPNFAIGAVLLMKVCESIAGYFDRAEIIEMHHDQKADAPSGTAIMTANLISENLTPQPMQEIEKFKGARGAKVDDIPVHSIRLPGLVAHQEVIFGLQGQTLTIRHDSIDRVSFMPGVVMAVKAIGGKPGFTMGLDKIMSEVGV